MYKRFSQLDEHDAFVFQGTQYRKTPVFTFNGIRYNAVSLTRQKTLMYFYDSTTVEVNE